MREWSHARAQCYGNSRREASNVEEVPSVGAGVVSTVARKPPLSAAMAIFGIVCNGLQSADTPASVPSVTT